jgi:oxaloacetate decarboxylase gamma subunit
MTIPEMLQQSAILTLLGMTVVFVFLWVMLICINLVGHLVHSLGWDKDVPSNNLGIGVVAKGNGEAGSQEITAAIIAAVTEYRKTEPGRE